MKIVIVLFNGEEKTYLCKDYSWDKNEDVIKLFDEKGKSYTKIIRLRQVAYWYVEKDD